MEFYRRLVTCSFSIGLVLLTQAVAYAHPGHAHPETVDGFRSGLLHPLMGLDHLLAMVAVGLLAVRIGGRGLWLVPLAFLGSILCGGLAAAAGLAVPWNEFGIVASVLALGLMIAMTPAFPQRTVVGLVMFFAFYHGHTHVAETLGTLSFAEYAAGFLLSTAALHVAGIAVGSLLLRLHRSDAVRFIGGAIAAAGLLMLAGLV
jgi:urease accessory protein